MIWCRFLYGGISFGSDHTHVDHEKEYGKWKRIHSFLSRAIVCHINELQMRPDITFHQSN